MRKRALASPFCSIPLALATSVAILSAACSRSDADDAAPAREHSDTTSVSGGSSRNRLIFLDEHSTGRTYSLSSPDSDEGWRVTTDVDWLRIDGRRPGKLAAGPTASIQIELDEDAAKALPAGLYATALVSGGVAPGVDKDVVTVITNPLRPGWTPLTPSASSRLVFVSSSEGNDGNDGLSVSAPKKTIAAGIAELRDGHPDWLLLRRGDVWTNEDFGSWRKSGHSLLERMVITSYGSDAWAPRPRVRTGSSTGFASHYEGFDDLAIVGIHLEPHTYTGTGGADGIKFNSGGRNILIEDCLIEGYSTNIVFQGSVGDWYDVAIRRNLLVNAYSTDSHSQGIFANDVHGLVLYENFMHHNGWREGVPGAEKTVFNHNAYLNVDCTGLDIQGNISTEASSHGLQVRPGGIVRDNLIVRCAIGMIYGSVGGSSAGALPQGVTGEIVNNVVLEGVDIGSKVAGKGIEIANISSRGGALVSDNIVAHNHSADIYGFGFKIDGPDQGFSVSDLVLRDNVIYDWHSPIIILGKPGIDLVDVSIQGNVIHSLGDIKKYDSAVRIDEVRPSHISFSDNTYHTLIPDPTDWFRIGSTYHDFDSWASESGDVGSVATQPSFLDPDRSLGSYTDTIQGTFGSTLDDFVAEWMKQSRQNWRPELRSVPIIKYIRAGFAL